MILSVLIASHVSRVEQLSRLLGSLRLPDGVEGVVLWNRGGQDRSVFYNALIADAQGDYVCFVDDDDRVADHYADAIVEALESEPDYVGFRVEVNDLSVKPINRRYRRYEASHSLRWRGWYQEGNLFFRDVSHLNPIRRDFALRVPFGKGRALDHDWAKRVRPFLSSEVFVDDVLYFYDYDAGQAVGAARDARRAVRPVLPDRFRWHPDSES